MGSCAAAAVLRARDACGMLALLRWRGAVSEEGKRGQERGRMWSAVCGPHASTVLRMVSICTCAMLSNQAGTRRWLTIR
jgi:hypothetical protein